MRSTWLSPTPYNLNRGVFYLRTVPTFHLIYELLANGEGELYADMEPMALSDIAAELRRRSGKRFDLDVDAWVNWFLSEESEADLREKNSITMCKRIYDLEKKSLGRIR